MPPRYTPLSLVLAGLAATLTQLLPVAEATAQSSQPTVIATIPSGGGVITANPTTNRVYVAQDPSPSLAVISGATNTVVGTVPTQGFHTGIAADPVRNRIYVSQQFAGQVRIIDGSTDAVLSDCSPPGPGVVNGVAVNLTTNRLYVVRNDAQLVAVADAATCAPVATIPINGPSPAGNGITVNPVTNRVYVSNLFNNTVTVIDGATNTVVTTVPVGNEPRGLDVNPVTNRVYVANFQASTVSVIDGASNTVTTTIPVGTGPVEVRANPARNRIYVANNGSSNVSVIDGTANTVVATVPVGPAPGDLAVNPVTSRIYVANSNGTVSVIEDREQVEEPPTATFLVIDEDSIDNGNPPNFFSAEDVNDDIAKLALRSELRYFNANQDKTIKLHTGTVGDEGWFAPKTIPPEWDAAGPTPDGLRNYVGNPGQPYPHNVGPGLGTGSDPEALLDKIPDVTPLRATGLEMLKGKTICAVVYDSDVSINYGPLSGSLKGANLGTVAFEVGTATPLSGGSSGSLPEVEITIKDAEEVCERKLTLFKEAPEPTSSSEPYDTGH